jgi:hypothetical protein
MKNFLKLFFAIFLFYSCSGNSPVSENAKEKETATGQLPLEAVVQAIKSKFPGAVPYQQGMDSILAQLNRFGIQPAHMLWGQSTCVDDIINTKNKLPPEMKGPFNFGGLAGLPFTGITGLNAFAHHAPEGGTVILFVGPHIGYNEKAGWGKILRHEQHQASSCCGALVAALAKLQEGKLKKQAPAPEDYQEGMIEQLAFANRKEILASPDPLLTFTRLTYLEAIRQMTFYASQVKERHFKYAVIVGGIIINTDYTLTDYLSIEKISILDVQKNVWVKGGKQMPGLRSK